MGSVELELGLRDGLSSVVEYVVRFVASSDGGGLVDKDVTS